ncbi:pH adaption potassium efflux protein D [gamma proteobacterium HdN1]|nr:pH adaption potassium efflux protein D [gamma proteobacterium HdN1]
MSTFVNLIPDMSQWIVAPVLLPLATAALMLLIKERHRPIKSTINLVSTLAGLTLSVLLLLWVNKQPAASAYGIYLASNWQAPFGIVLVLDRLSAMMLVLANMVGLASLSYALTRWHHAGVQFHVLFQLQLMGLYGAFLTGDLFNLFVFFEVLLAASYGLLLHGGGSARVRAGLHYVAVNLLASLLFLIGVAVIYGVTGTLNMADIAQKLLLTPASDRGLLHAGAAILALAFLTKAAVWPLNFWLPGAYTTASAPVAALFAILTKVGIYSVLRLWTLCFPTAAGDSALFGADALVWGGIATLIFGAIGILAASSVRRIAAFSIITSSGTLIAAFGFSDIALGSGALFYLASSTLSGCALFLLVELLERARQISGHHASIDHGHDTLHAFVDTEPMPDTNLDDDEKVLVGRVIPAALAFLGMNFAIATVIIAGLPPLSGFISKLTMLQALIDLHNTAGWTLFALLIVSGLLAAMALMRQGIRHFWSSQERPSLRMHALETLPIMLLLGTCILLAAWGEPVLSYMHATAEALHQPQGYIDAVMAAQPVDKIVTIEGIAP